MVQSRSVTQKTRETGELWRLDRVFDTAFAEDVNRVQTETSLPVFAGAPEA